MVDINNAIALGVKPLTDFYDPTQTALANAQIRQSALQNQLAMVRFKREVDQQDRQNRALGMLASNEPDAASKAFALSPEIGLKIQEFRSKARENEVADFTRANTMVAQAAQGVLSAPPEQRQAIYAQERQRLVRSGIIKPDAIPPTYDEGFVRAALQRALSAEQFLSQPMVGGRPVSEFRAGGASAPASAPPAGPSTVPAAAPAVGGGGAARLIQAESGGNPSAFNQFGFAGAFQFGAPRLADLGLYSPGGGENIRAWSKTSARAPGKWSGEFHIPGHPEVRTLSDFLGSPAAQKTAFALHIGKIDEDIQARGLDRFIGQSVAGVPITLQGLRNMAHLGGIGNVQKVLASNGQVNPTDANGTSLLSYAAMGAQSSASPAEAALANPRGQPAPLAAPAPAAAVAPLSPDGAPQPHINVAQALADRQPPPGSSRVDEASTPPAAPTPAPTENPARVIPVERQPLPAVVGAPGLKLGLTTNPDGSQTYVFADKGKTYVQTKPIGGDWTSPAEASAAPPLPTFAQRYPGSPDGQHVPPDALANGAASGAVPFFARPGAPPAPQAPAQPAPATPDAPVPAGPGSAVGAMVGAAGGRLLGGQAPQAPGAPSAGPQPAQDAPPAIPATPAAASAEPASAATPAAPDAQPVFVKGKPYTEGAPPGFQWGINARGEWVQMEVPGAAGADKEMVAINDPTSPTGQRMVPRHQVRGGYVPAKDATEGQANARLFASRMEQADPIISKFESAGLSGRARFASEATFPFTNQRLVPQDWVNMNVSKDFQQLAQAERNFLNAVLRRESGAVISAEEFDNGSRQYFPRPGDSPEVLAQKRANRQAAIEGIKRASQPGFGASGPTGTPPDGAPLNPPAPPAPAARSQGGPPPPPPGFVLVR